MKIYFLEVKNILLVCVLFYVSLFPPNTLWLSYPIAQTS